MKTLFEKKRSYSSENAARKDKIEKFLVKVLPLIVIALIVWVWLRYGTITALTCLGLLVFASGIGSVIFKYVRKAKKKVDEQKEKQQPWDIR